VKCGLALAREVINELSLGGSPAFHGRKSLMARSHKRRGAAITANQVAQTLAGLGVSGSEPGITGRAIKHTEHPIEDRADGW
jgi:hypothetical protein